MGKTKIYFVYSKNASASGRLRILDPLSGALPLNPTRGQESHRAPLPPLFCNHGYSPSRVKSYAHNTILFDYI